MNRRDFLALSVVSMAAVASTVYMIHDTKEILRTDLADDRIILPLYPDEKQILQLASLAPSGHNTQPWFIKYLEPYHWIVACDRARWLPAVDPDQRETILSIGAFIQNLEYAASGFGYDCEIRLVALNNQAENIAEVTLKKNHGKHSFDPMKIKLRRTLRSGYLDIPLRNEHVKFITGNESDYFHLIKKGSEEYRWLNQQTIEANRRQFCRDDAQSELADWLRLSSRDARKYRDGLTTASMEIYGFKGWFVRKYYSREDVLRNSFRERSMKSIVKQVSRSGGWLVVTSRDGSTASLVETGMRLQRMLLKVRETGIAIHPMTQVLEESPFREAINPSIGISDPIQFLLRTGYVKEYPEPVSLRRPLSGFVSI